MIKVGILGLGLIGGSILKRLSNNKKYKLFCYSNSSYKKAEKFCTSASNNIEILSCCDIIFVCCQISKTLEYLDKLNTFLDKNTIVVDVSSIKSFLLDKKYNFNFILSHPMSGTEYSGFDASFEDLFVGNKWLVEKENKILYEIIKDLGSEILKIDMTQHDKMCAQISHLPAILSFLLFDCADDYSKQIASSGFRDTTRLAMTNSNLIFSMFNDNKENVLNAFNNLIERMNCLKKLSDDEKIKLFEEIAQKRAKMYDNLGKNIFKV